MGDDIPKRCFIEDKAVDRLIEGVVDLLLRSAWIGEVDRLVLLTVARDFFPPLLARVEDWWLVGIGNGGHIALGQ